MTRWRRRWTLGLLIVLAGFGSACDLIEIADAALTEEVKTELGIDLNDPTQIIGLVALNKFTGDKNRETALDLVRDVRRVQHQVNGDDAFKRRDYDAAVTEYRVALKWAQPSPTELFSEPAERRRARAKVEASLGAALFSQALSWEQSGVPVVQRTYLEPARRLENAIPALKGTYEGDATARLAAMSYRRMGDIEKACKLLGELMQTSTTIADGDMWRLWRCDRP